MNRFYERIFAIPESRKGSGSGGSGYISDNKNDSCSSTVSKQIGCPTCGARTEVPLEGVSSFPPNYLLQHRMVLATLNAQNTHLLCDLCTSEISVMIFLSMNSFCAYLYFCRRRPDAWIVPSVFVITVKKCILGKNLRQITRFLVSKKPGRKASLELEDKLCAPNIQI